MEKKIGILKSDYLSRKLWILASIFFLAVTFARIVYSGWLSPLFFFPMRGDGIRSIFSGVNGYFLPGPWRTLAEPILNHPCLSLTFYYSIFHTLCMSKLLGVVLSVTAHMSAVFMILFSLVMFDPPKDKKMFALLLIIFIFNWAPFYDGVSQGFPAEFIEVFGIIFSFFFLLKGNPISAGIMLGLASTVKVLPVIFIAYFIYKKEFRLVIATIFTCLSLSAVILWRENFNPNLFSLMAEVIGSRIVYGHNARDPGLSAFIDFVFRRSLPPNMLVMVHYIAFVVLVFFFLMVECRIKSKRDRYLFGLAGVSLAMFQVSSRITEMYAYVLLLPALIFDIWILARYRDKLFGVFFTVAYIFMHGFSLFNILFRLKNGVFLFFNEHGGVFIGAWLLYFSTYGMVLKYLTDAKRIE